MTVDRAAGCGSDRSHGAPNEPMGGEHPASIDVGHKEIVP